MGFVLIVKRFLLLLPLLLLLPGCQTTGVSSITPAKVQQFVDEGVGTFVSLRLKNRPESRVVFERVRAALDNLVLHQVWSLSAFHEALISADVEAVTTSDMALYITPGISLVQLFIQGANVDISQVDYARAVIVGANIGITRALLNRPNVTGKSIIYRNLDGWRELQPIEFTPYAALQNIQ